MNVLTCAACGSHLTEPLRHLPGPAPRPEFDASGPYETDFLPDAVRVTAV
ncbi:hypothetical protein [Streptomyces griseorubiginosus]|nr:hypothetical protein [Streptomyces griseorubiginosus]